MFVEPITITLAPGAQYASAMRGSQFKVLDAPYPLAEIALSDESGSAAAYLKNVDSGAYAKTRFAGFVITNGATAQTITFQLSDGDAGTDKLPGTVRVIDDSVAKTMVGRQGFIYGRRLAAAAKFGMIGVVTGALPLAIKKLSFWQAVGGIVGLYTATGNPTDTPNVGGAFRNKNLAAGSLATVSTSGLSAGSVPTVGELPGVQNVGAFQVPANTVVDYPLTTPIVVPKNTVFVVTGSAINTEIGVFIDGEEFF
jgi:hypothetical protein